MEEAVASDPLMVRELKKQHHDLSKLQNIGPLTADSLSIATILLLRHSLRLDLDYQAGWRLAERSAIRVTERVGW